MNKTYDFKKVFPEQYKGKIKPSIINIPKIRYLSINGIGDPNEEDGMYNNAIKELYTIVYTIRMSYKGSHKIDGFFEFVVPPLQGFWWMNDGSVGVDSNNKEGFAWISLIRVPEFVTEDVLKWAINDSISKGKLESSRIKLLDYEEGLTVQALHIGSYDDEIKTVKMMQEFVMESGYEENFEDSRYHHEIYLSDPRRTSPEKLKTIIRHPIRKKT